MNSTLKIINLTIFCFILSHGSVYPYEVKKNDIMSYLRSKGHDDVTVDKHGDITVGIAAGAIDFKMDILLKKSGGKAWAIKTMHIVPVKITRDKVDFMIRLTNIYNRRKGIFRTSYVKKKGNKYKIIIKSWFPCQYVNDDARDSMFEEYYSNSFKMMTSQLKKIYSASKCVLNNSTEKDIKTCLEEYELSSGF